MARYDTPEKRAKHAARQRAWRAANPEKWSEIAHAARVKWKVENRDAHREAQRAHRFTLRREIIDLLGGQRCVHCGYDNDWRALQIDHINGDGRTDPHTNAGTGNMWAFRTKLLDPGFNSWARDRYQVLCANCNRIKQYDERGFPGERLVPHEKNLRRKKMLGIK